MANWNIGPMVDDPLTPAQARLIAEALIGTVEHTGHIDYHTERIEYITQSYPLGGGIWWASDIIAPPKEAEKKARKLLLRFLTPQQQASYTKVGFFDVTVNLSSAYDGTYRLFSKRTNNVLHLKSKSCYCAGPKNSLSLPIGDILLSQKLMLESDPHQFFEKANVLVESVFWGVPMPAHFVASIPEYTNRM